MQLLLFSQSERCTRPPCSRSAAPDGATTHILVRRLAQRRHEQLSTCRIEPAGRSNAPGDWPDARLGLGQREVGRGERWRCSAGAGGVLSRPFASIAKPALFGKVLLHRGCTNCAPVSGLSVSTTGTASSSRCSPRLTLGILLVQSRLLRLLQRHGNNRCSYPAYGECI